MKRPSILTLLPVAFGLAAGVAEGQTVTFDEPGYSAGQLPPNPPWSEEYGKTDWGVVAGAGLNGTQGLDARSANNHISYTLSTPLTAANGPVSISVLLDPAGPSSSAYYQDYAGVQVGNGSRKYDTGNYLGLVFREVGDSQHGIYGPGYGYGTYLGSFTPSAQPNWYELRFDVNAAWDSMTISAGPLGGGAVSGSFAWDGSPIEHIWLLGNSMYGYEGGQTAIFDNLAVSAVPLPAAAWLLGSGLLGLLAVARRTERNGGNRT